VRRDCRRSDKPRQIRAVPRDVRDVESMTTLAAQHGA
jgi:hypothetical protein